MLESVKKVIQFKFTNENSKLSKIPSFCWSARPININVDLPSSLNSGIMMNGENESNRGGDGDLFDDIDEILKYANHVNQSFNETIQEKKYFDDERDTYQASTPSEMGLW